MFWVFSSFFFTNFPQLVPISHLCRPHLDTEVINGEIITIKGLQEVFSHLMAPGGGFQGPPGPDSEALNCVQEKDCQGNKGLVSAALRTDDIGTCCSENPDYEQPKVIQTSESQMG